MPLGAMTRDFIKELLSKGAREYGRGFMDFRNIDMRTGVLPNAEGSAEVFFGNTRVLVGVKLDVGEPLRDKPNEGDLRFAAELLPLAAPEYEAGPPSPEAIELGRVVDRGIRAGKVIDLTSLFIEEGKVWSVFADIYVLNYDGNLFDASTLASVAAILTAKMPKYENEQVIREGNLGRLKTDNVVTSCTFGRIGDKTLLDLDANEERSAQDARVTITNDEKYLRAMQKGGSGAFSSQEVDRLIEATFEKSKDLRTIIKRAIGE